MAIELVSYDDIKDFLDLTEVSISSYPALSVIRDGVTAAFESYLLRELETKERTQIITVYSATPMVSLPAIPVTSVSSFTDMYSTTYSEANGDFVRTQYGLRMIDIEFESNELSITYTGGASSGGYISDALMKAALGRAALIQCVYEWQTRDFVGSTSVSTDGGSVRRPALSLLGHVRRMLDPYRHPMRIGHGN